MGAFMVFLPELNANKLNEGLTRVFKRCEKDASTNSEIACFTRIRFPIATVSAHGMKEIVTIVQDSFNMKDLISVMRQLFEKGKTTNLAIIIRAEYK